MGYAVRGTPAQVKKTPFCSRPRTVIRLAAGSAGLSESKWKPAWSAVHVIVAPVLRNEPSNPCAALRMFAVASAPSQTISNDTVAWTGKIGGMGGLGKP